MTKQTSSKLLALCAFGAALTVASAPASAQFYAGASLGPTTVDLCDDLSGLGVTGCDDDDTGLKVFAGTGINRNLAVEFGWVDLGKLTASAPGGPVRLDVDGIQVAALGILPLTPTWRAFGKAGLYLWDASARGPGGSFSDDGTDIMFGGGAAWNIARGLDLRFEWERFDIDGDDIDMFSAGVQFSF